jgi:hypothetical protein
MTAYIRQLRKFSDANEELRRETEARAAIDAARERLSPIEDRLARLIAAIPADVLAEGLSLPSLQRSVRGRWRGKAHPGDLGQALRRLGFARRRSWHGGEGGFRALWYPEAKKPTNVSRPRLHA